VLENQRKKHGSPDYRAANGVMREVLVRLLGEDYRDDLATISAPTRFVWGELDDQAPADAGEVASTLVPGATWRMVPGAGHLMTGALATAVREELDTLEVDA
jgi:pimeloyl-ACP methyl ester carboxylesterase